MNVQRLLELFELYAQKHGIAINPDERSVDRILEELLINDEIYGQRFCPSRSVSGDTEKDRLIICPCVYHLDEVELMGKCRCNLFVEKSESSMN